MSSNDTRASDGASRSRYRFSLLALLVLITVCSLMAGVWRKTRHYTVTAYLQVKLPAPNRPTKDEWENVMYSQPAFILSDSVLWSVINKSRTSKLSSEQERAATILEIRNRVQVDFPGGVVGEVIELRMEGSGVNSSGDERLLKSIIDEYILESESRKETLKLAPDIRILRAPQSEKN